MKSIIKKLPSLVMVLLSASIAASVNCPVDTSWKGLSFSLQLSRLQSGIMSIENPCMAKAIAMMAESKSQTESDSLIPVIREWSKHNPLDYKVLFAAYSNDHIHRNRALWSQILALWKRDNSPNPASIALEKSGELLAADTLFRICDSEGMLDFPELLRWAKVKFIIGEISAIPRLYCRILTREPQSAFDSSNIQRKRAIIHSQFASQIENLPGDKAVAFLDEFKKCSLEKMEPDSALLRSWLSEAYSSIGLFDKEIEILTSLCPNNLLNSVASELIDFARERFLYGQFVPSLHASKAAYSRTKNPAIQSDAATVIYQSFLALGFQDSAYMWSKKADLSSEVSLIDATRLYQHAGQLQQSQLFIDKMPSSLTKDTLQIRQYLMSREKGKASSSFNSSKFLKQSPTNLLLWKIRLLVFNNKIDDLTAAFDSLLIPTESEGTAELLNYKYWLQRLEDHPEALAIWTEIEYNIYTGILEKCIPLIQNKNIDPSYQWRLALKVALALHDSKRLSDALVVLSNCDEHIVSAEFLYYKAQFLLEKGNIEAAKGLLQHLVLDFPNEIYSGKARLLLTKFE